MIKIRILIFILGFLSQNLFGSEEPQAKRARTEAVSVSSQTIAPVSNTIVCVGPKFEKLQDKFGDLGNMRMLLTYVYYHLYKKKQESIQKSHLQQVRGDLETDRSSQVVVLEQQAVTVSAEEIEKYIEDYFLKIEKHSDFSMIAFEFKNLFKVQNISLNPSIDQGIEDIYMLMESYLKRRSKSSPKVPRSLSFEFKLNKDNHLLVNDVKEYLRPLYGETGEEDFNLAVMFLIRAMEERLPELIYTTFNKVTALSLINDKVWDSIDSGNVSEDEDDDTVDAFRDDDVVFGNQLDKDNIKSRVLFSRVSKEDTEVTSEDPFLQVKISFKFNNDKSLHSLQEVDELKFNCWWFLDHCVEFHPHKMDNVKNSLQSSSTRCPQIETIMLFPRNKEEFNPQKQDYRLSRDLILQSLCELYRVRSPEDLESYSFMNPTDHAIYKIICTGKWDSESNRHRDDIVAEGQQAMAFFLARVVDFPIECITALITKKLISIADNLFFDKKVQSMICSRSAYFYPCLYCNEMDPIIVYKGQKLYLSQLVKDGKCIDPTTGTALSLSDRIAVNRKTRQLVVAPISVVGHDGFPGEYDLVIVKSDLWKAGEEKVIFTTFPSLDFKTGKILLRHCHVVNFIASFVAMVIKKGYRRDWINYLRVTPTVFAMQNTLFALWGVDLAYNPEYTFTVSLRPRVGHGNWDRVDFNIEALFAISN
jgi:hypothetical protein